MSDGTWRFSDALMLRALCTPFASEQPHKKISLSSLCVILCGLCGKKSCTSIGQDWKGKGKGKGGILFSTTYSWTADCRLSERVRETVSVRVAARFHKRYIWRPLGFARGPIKCEISSEPRLRSVWATFSTSHIEKGKGQGKGWDRVLNDVQPDCLLSVPDIG
jgi:hypothetical protein